MKRIKHPEIRYQGEHCQLVIQQCSNQVVVMRITGSDVGEFGDSPMLELNRHLASFGAIQFFIDARKVRGASINVSGDWAKWLGAKKEHLREVHMLTGSRFVQITADFVRRFADLQSIMKLYTDPAAFEDVLTESLARLP